MTGNAALPPEPFDKEDVGDDLAFYAQPRLVTHIDEVAVEALAAFYRELLPANGRVLISCRAGSATYPATVATPKWSATA